MVPELLDDDMADDELLDATLGAAVGGAADKRDTELLDTETSSCWMLLMVSCWTLSSAALGPRLLSADQPDTELLDAEPLHRASELTSATIFWRFNAKLQNI